MTLLFAAPATMSAQSGTLNLEELRLEGVTEFQVAAPQRIRTLPPGERTVTLSPREYVIGKTGTEITERVTKNKKTLVLPYRLYRIAPSGEKLELEPVIEIIGGGLRYRSRQEGYGARLDIGVIDVNEPNVIKPLPQAVRFLVNAEVDSLTPNNLVECTRTFDFKSVTLHILSPPDTVAVRIRPSFLTETLRYELGVIRPALSVTANPPVIYGLGLQTSVITVMVDGLADIEGFPVSVSTDRGNLNHTTLTLSQDGRGTITLRSLSFGEAVVTAIAPTLGSYIVTVQFVPPWLFLIAVIAGGAAGAGIRLTTAGTDRRKPGGRTVLCRLVRGVLLGLLAAVAYTVGVNLTGFTFPAELSGFEGAIAFVISGLAAYAGKLKLEAAPGNAGGGTT